MTEWEQEYRRKLNCQKCPLYPCKRTQCTEVVVMHSGKWVLVTQNYAQDLSKREKEHLYRESRETFDNGFFFKRLKAGR